MDSEPRWTSRRMMTAVTHFEVDADAYEVVIRDPPRSYDSRRPEAVSMKNEKSVSVGAAASTALISRAMARREHVAASAATALSARSNARGVVVLIGMARF